MSMTDKQRTVIGYIEENLQIQYNGGDDKKSASDFIQKYFEKSKEAVTNRSVFDHEIDGGWGIYGEMFMPDLPGEV